MAVTHGIMLHPLCKPQGYFFDHTDSSIQSHDSDDPLLADHVTLSAEIDPPFRRINTTWIIVVQIFLLVVLCAAVFVVPVLCSGGKCGTSDYSIVSYSHGGLWVLLTAIDRYLRYHHYISRTMGYLEFYRQTRHVRRLPVTVHSGANAALVVLLTVLENYCDSHTNICGGNLSKQNFLQILICIEVAIILPISVLYLVRTVRFNKQAATPDVQQDEMMTSFLQSRSISTDVGFRDEEYVDQVMEKQADMIRYLKQHNAHLSKKILSLTADVNRLKS